MPGAQKVGALKGADSKELWVLSLFLKEGRGQKESDNEGKLIYEMFEN